MSGCSIKKLALNYNLSWIYTKLISVKDGYN